MRIFIICILFWTLIFSTQSSAICPNLSGEYHCMISPTQYSLLVIKQISLTEELEQFSFNYTAIPGGADIFTASSQGETDGWGYINRCTKTRLLSMASDGSALAELYLNTENHLVYRLNGAIVYQCPRRAQTPAFY